MPELSELEYGLIKESNRGVFIVLPISKQQFIEGIILSLNIEKYTEAEAEVDEYQFDDFENIYLKKTMIRKEQKRKEFIEK